MPFGLHDVPVRTAATAAMMLVPAALIALLSMPWSLHHRLDPQPIDPNAPTAAAARMT